jgi:thioredoxin-related protein
MDSDLSAFQAMKTRGLPTTIFLNEKGEEIARAEGPLDWKNDAVKKFIEEKIQ